ncbi:uncharacterized protein J4E92_009250 [Alternaria infectoria]|uniref:uncharacterized protein n=1 Tax=Alternaria infectoria TaxID=45303 RepID=UPI002220F7D3|nr:uncharacterized protein J4E92_009250 [Alternaria infectoria]KAI4916333.1 hypothetical protein J4E92_009250 [Alternaria infectoria]
MAPTTTTPSEIERLRAKCHEALKGASKTELKQKTLELQRQKLRDRDYLLREELCTDGFKAADALSAFAQADCLELCTKVQNAFPREIRDIIYSYITGDKDVSIACNVPWCHTCEWHSHSSRSLSCCVPEYVKAAHWWKREYMGAQMVREIGENYYRSSHFVFEHIITNVVPFRSVDHLGLGFKPVDFISDVEVTINCRDYRFEPMDREGNSIPTDIHARPADSEASWGGEPFREVPDRLLVELESLFGFRHGTAITINLSSKLCENATLLEQQAWMAYTVIPVIFPVLQRLKDAGCRVRILLSAKEEWSKRSFTSKWNPKSSEVISQAVQEYVKVEQDRLSQAELEFTVVSDDESETSTVFDWSAFYEEEVASNTANET